jgi:hypothetical protein
VPLEVQRFDRNAERRANERRGFDTVEQLVDYADDAA